MTMHMTSSALSNQPPSESTANVCVGTTTLLQSSANGLQFQMYSELAAQLGGLSHGSRVGAWEQGWGVGAGLGRGKARVAAQQGSLESQQSQVCGTQGLAHGLAQGAI